MEEGRIYIMGCLYDSADYEPEKTWLGKVLSHGCFVGCVYYLWIALILVVSIIGFVYGIGTLIGIL